MCNMWKTHQTTHESGNDLTERAVLSMTYPMQI